MATADFDPAEMIAGFPLLSIKRALVFVGIMDDRDDIKLVADALASSRSQAERVLGALERRGLVAPTRAKKQWTKTQLGWQLIALGAIASFTFVTAWASFVLIDRTMGLRAPEDAELQGLDIVEHGMYGYPERFIEVPGATPDDALPELTGAPAGAATAWEGES